MAGDSRTGERRSGGRLRWGAGALLFLALVLLIPAEARAHALLVRSLPEADAELVEPPAAVEMWFSEPLEAGFSGARLLDASGAEISTGAAQVNPLDPFHMTLPLERLEPGIYTVAWQTLSQADGHEWAGFFPFTVLYPDGTHPGGAAASIEGTNGAELPTLPEVGARWLLLLGSMLLFGLPLFGLVVQPQKEGESELAAYLSSLLVRGLWLGLAFLVAGSAWQLVNQAARLSSLEALPALLLTTRGGNLALARLALAGVVLLLVVMGTMAKASRRPSQVLLAVAALLLLSISAGSHAAALTGRGWTILVDYAHLVAAAAWLGGLLLLPLLGWRARGASPGERQGFAVLVRRFSALAGLAILVLTATGIFSSLVQVPGLYALFTTSYGQVLLGKVALVALVIGIAFFNRRLIGGEHWGAQEGKAARRFNRQVTLEAGVAITIMVTVAVLVQTTVPARAQDAIDNTYEEVLAADDLAIHVQVSPNQAGQNDFLVHLYHQDGSSVGEVQLVRLFFEYLDDNVGQAVAEMEPITASLFHLEGAFLSRAGAWELSVYVRRRGLDDTLVSTPLGVASPGGSSGSMWQNPLPGLPPSLTGAGVLLVVGIGLWYGRDLLVRRAPRRARWLHWIGGAAIAVAATIVFFTAPDSGVERRGRAAGHAGFDCHGRGALPG
jgi:copper transport protein